MRGKQMMAVAAVAVAAVAAQAERTGPWPKEKAWAWYGEQPWMRGANYMSKSCCNRVDQWQEHGFEERFREQDEELALAKSIGFNTMRILLLSEGFDVWLQDHDGFMNRFDRTLDLLARHGMRAIVVLGNDCSRPERTFSVSKLGPQKVDWGYHGGRGFSQHGSAPNEVGYIVADHPVLGPKFFAFCEEVMRTHAHDRRIVVWNLWNEPGANNRQQKGLSPLKKIFELAWKVDPDQPLMADIWRTYGRDPNDLCESYAAEHSDVISYHCYEDIAGQVALIKDLRARYGRPLLITEWLCRMMHNCVHDAYPLYEMEDIAAFTWGFVNGKYQTQEPWECIWTDVKNGKGDKYNFREWFHDLYRPSLRPYDPAEIEIIKRINADADANRRGASLRKKIEKHCGAVEGDLWYGYRRWKFRFQGHDAWVVEPSTKTADGTPWTWTIQWSEHFVDRTGVLDLLKRGWHHVFVDGYDERGSDAGVARFAAFQKLLVEKLGLAPTAHLVGMSWGGFFSVRYAAAHPENVEKLYLDAPLLTFAPGFDESLGPWEKAKPADGDWTKDPRMPVNMAAKLAAAQIPVLLLYGKQDQSVPPALNCERFIADFRKHGGEITVDCRGGFGHHPHGLDPDKTQPIVDFFQAR